VHAGLVADLDRGGQVTEQRAARLDDGVLGLPGQIGGIEIGQVVVQDARLGRLPGHDVPHRLTQASGHHIPARQAYDSRPGQHLSQRLVTQQDRLERGHLDIHREPAEIHGHGVYQHPASERSHDRPAAGSSHRGRPGDGTRAPRRPPAQRHVIIGQRPSARLGALPASAQPP